MDPKKPTVPGVKVWLERAIGTRQFSYGVIGLVFLDLCFSTAGLVLAIRSASTKLNVILIGITMMFTVAFVVELAVSICVAGGFKAYFTSYKKITDGVIIVFSAVTEIALAILYIEHSNEASILLRPWTMLRLFHVHYHITQIQSNAKHTPTYLVNSLPIHLGLRNNSVRLVFDPAYPDPNAIQTLSLASHPYLA
ncbi:hypothetical protein DSO57_1014872 [Entomophthora muscae]|uniref:Uncharacterized protein n=1 Tax=Entomophthora muscae TaxID=34485 RepID=A0ACC2TSP6_9FUNG|nr:hypothetical protein DSO57_1014872 [Entomophthora muscae]